MSLNITAIKLGNTDVRGMNALKAGASWKMPNVFNIQGCSIKSVHRLVNHLNKVMYWFLKRSYECQNGDGKSELK